MANEYWLTDEAWPKIGPSIPTGWRAAKKVEALSIDSTASKAYRCGAGREGGGRQRPTP